MKSGTESPDDSKDPRTRLAGCAVRNDHDVVRHMRSPKSPTGRVQRAAKIDDADAYVPFRGGGANIRNVATNKCLSPAEMAQIAGCDADRASCRRRFHTPTTQPRETLRVNHAPPDAMACRPVQPPKRKVPPKERARIQAAVWQSASPDRGGSNDSRGGRSKAHILRRIMRAPPPSPFAPGFPIHPS